MFGLVSFYACRRGWRCVAAAARHAWTLARSGISSGQGSWASGSHALLSASAWAIAGHNATRAMNAIASGARNSLVCKDIGAPDTRDGRLPAGRKRRVGLTRHATRDEG